MYVYGEFFDMQLDPKIDHLEPGLAFVCRDIPIRCARLHARRIDKHNVFWLQIAVYDAVLAKNDERVDDLSRKVAYQDGREATK